MLKNILHICQQKLEEHRQFFNYKDEELVSSNFHSLQIASTACTSLLLFFLLITPYMFSKWKITIHYILFIPFSLVFTALSFFWGRQKIKNSYVINFSCLLFGIMLISFLIAIDVFSYPDYACTFVPMFIAICPTLFILPYMVMIPYILISELTFILLVFNFKGADVIGSDIFSSLVGTILGLFVL